MELYEFFAHKVHQVQNEFLAVRCRDIFLAVRKVQDHFVRAVHADCGKVVIPIAKVTAGKRIKAIFHVLGYNTTFDFQNLTSHVHQSFQIAEQTFAVALVHIAKPRKVHGHNADRTRLFRRTEQTATAL